jgi:hypothetical protein
MLLLSLLGAALTAPLALALGEPKVIYFPNDSPTTSGFETGDHQAIFTSSSTKADSTGFTIASKKTHYVVPFLLDSQDNVAIHLAARTLARDIHSITGIQPRLYNDTLPSNVTEAVIIGSVDSKVVGAVDDGHEYRSTLAGRWESFDVRVSKKPLKHLDSGLVISGSDRVGSSPFARASS